MSFDLYKCVSDRLIDKLSVGIVPWRKLWGTYIPYNYDKGIAYRGLNLLLLSDLGYSEPQWMTWKEIQMAGGRVIKGNKGSVVVYWQKRRNARCGGALIPCFMYARVWNKTQIEGIDFEHNVLTPLLTFDGIYHGMSNKPNVITGTVVSSYNADEDTVSIADIESFETEEDYKFTYIRQLVKSCFHSDRLSIKAKLKGTEDSFRDLYSINELGFDIATYMLLSLSCQDVSNVSLPHNYIQMYISKFKEDKKFIVHACRMAQNAVDYIMGN